MKVIANALLNNKLAACVNMIPRMRSKYGMDGRLTEAREVILLIKTRILIGSLSLQVQVVLVTG